VNGINWLSGVVAISPTSAWAVGAYSPANIMVETLIARWAGSGWQRVKSPNPGGADAVLNDVAATSRTDAWAVGYFGGQTLIVHWDGTSWTRAPSPNPVGAWPRLNSVTAISAANAWTVGTYQVGSTSQTLIERWNGTTWTQESSPNPASVSSGLFGVDAISAFDAWAVGYAGGKAQALQYVVREG